MVAPKEENNYHFKVIVVGEGGVGKTTLITRYATNKFIESTRMTIGAGFTFFDKEVNGGTDKIRLNVWDFGGEKRFRFILPSYCKGSNGVIFVFDLTRTTTLWNLEDWIKLVNENTDIEPIFFLAGTKADLIEKKGLKMMSFMDEQISEFLQKHELPADLYFKICSLTGQNVPEIFDKMANLLYKMER
ncbi:MAG: Rab family GTPase [Promethearchaeota archaeon]